MEIKVKISKKEIEKALKPLKDDFRREMTHIDVITNIVAHNIFGRQLNKKNPSDKAIYQKIREGVFSAFLFGLKRGMRMGRNTKKDPSDDSKRVKAVSE